MSDGESPTPSPRKRPSYGLPGPSGPSADPGLPAQPEPGSQWAQDRSEPFGSFSGPSFGSSAGSPAGPAPSPQAPRRKQRGPLPLIIGIVLLVVVEIGRAACREKEGTEVAARA